MIDLTAFKEHIGQIQDLNLAQGLLSWDLETCMPEKGAEIRAKQMATLSTLSHDMLASAETARFLEDLRLQEHYRSLDRTAQALVREVGKEYDRAKKIPSDLVRELTETTAKAHHAWVEARKTNQFQLFAPILEKIVELNRRMAQCLGFSGSPYNALMDLYEPELTTDKTDALFNNIKPGLIKLVQAIRDSEHQPDTRFLKRVTRIEKQQAFSETVIKAMGFDMQAGRIDKAPHPFCAGFGPGDVRLTNRYFKNEMLSSLFSAMHEAGHGLYEQGMDPALGRTPLSEGASLGIHESQSRLWENMVGRSREFWKYYLPRLKKVFPKQLEGIGLESFYRAINRSQPSLIRVEADEVTYNLHIMLRYEIERALIEEKASVRDIPALWTEKMREYLGITPPNDALGALQDIHWAHGSFGYFPTYTLGNLYAAQFFRQAEKEIPGLKLQIAKGNFKPLKTWLNEKIHRIGRIETPAEIVFRVTGEPLNAHYFMAYLQSKFTEIYQLPASYTISSE